MLKLITKLDSNKKQKKSKFVKTTCFSKCKKVRFLF